MTFGTEWRFDAGGYVLGRSLRDPRPQRILACAGLACVAFLCAWTIYNNLTRGTDQIELANDGFGKGDKLVAVPPSSAAASNAMVSDSGGSISEASDGSAASPEFDRLFDSRPLFDSRYAWHFAPEAFSQIASLQGNGESQATAAAAPTTTTATVAASSPTTIRDAQAVASTLPRDGRNAQSAAPPHIRMAQTATVHTGVPRTAANEPIEQPTLFERLFGKVFNKPAGPMLAYANPDDGGVSDGRSLVAGRYDRWTAVYDISAHKVYLPDGTTLEAHSGLGRMLDDPRSAGAKDRGVTPPDIYDLQPREALFHGVPALRLIPVDDSKVFGRSGLLAHSFMLGPNGDSNGCVSFRDYDAFLQAYRNHEIKRLAVVARLD